MNWSSIYVFKVSDVHAEYSGLQLRCIVVAQFFSDSTLLSERLFSSSTASVSVVFLLEIEMLNSPNMKKHIIYKTDNLL